MIVIIERISNIIWIITTFFIMYVGIYYTVKLKAPQFNIKRIFKSLKKDNNGKSSSIKILNLTLAGKIGVGSIAGIALCIFIGGKGTIFWLWISSFILASLSYVETKLGILYQKKTRNEYIGGPSFYIESGLKNKKLAQIYSSLIIIAYVFAFISIQTNTIIISVVNVVNVNKTIVVLLLAILIYISVRKGIKTISKISYFLVPVMGGLYILIGLYVIFNDLSISFSVLKSIVESAFSDARSLIIAPVIIGIERGIFSNEAGIGTTAMISSMTDSKNMEKQANIQVLGTYFTSLIICTITAFIILTCDYSGTSFSNINGIELVSYSLFQYFGYPGIIILTIIIFLFAFSTIVTSYYYGEINLGYLTNKNKNNTLLRIIVIIIVIYSSYSSPTILWNTVDVVVALIALINIYAMYKLRKDIEEKKNDRK